jgi:hypothetical protein
MRQLGPGRRLHRHTGTLKQSADIDGSDGTAYEVTLWLRGMVEPMSHEDGITDNFWHTVGLQDSLADRCRTHELLDG